MDGVPFNRFLRDDDPGIQLIETLRRVDGDYPRLAGHLARLRNPPPGWALPLMNRGSGRRLPNPLPGGSGGFA